MDYGLWIIRQSADPPGHGVQGISIIIALRKNNVIVVTVIIVVVVAATVVVGVAATIINIVTNVTHGTEL